VATTNRTTAAPPDNQAVHRALSALAMLAESPTPLSGGEIGRRLGIHQTSASRLVRSLVGLGYAREVPGGFVPDLQLFSLVAEASQSYPLVVRYHDTMAELSRSLPNFDVTMVTLHQRRPLYFLRSRNGQPAPLSTQRWPLHLSVASLRLLLELPEDEALEALELDSAALPWERPTALTPADPVETLTRARRSLHGDALVLSGWVLEGHRAGAIPVAIGEPTTFVIALSVDQGSYSEDDFVSLLHRARQAIENT